MKRMNVMDAHCQMIMDEFIENLPVYEKIKELALNTLQTLLAKEGLYVTAVEGRVKAQKSLEGKLELKGYKYKTIGDITDIIGVRVITFYSSEVDKIAALVEQNFDIDWENSVDKRKVNDPDRFGYMSLHYICRIPKKLYYDPECPLINEVPFEVQMRTALQHVWATAYHDTGYKSDVEIPQEYIRALSRLAGVLEIADEQFDGIISNLADYRRRVRSLVKGGAYDDLSIDGDTFSAYLDIKPFERLNDRIASINKAEISKTTFDPYLGIFKWMGIKTLGDIERMKADDSDDAYRLAALQMSGTDLDILSETIGLQNLCLVHIIKNGGGDMDLKKFYDSLYGIRKRNITSAQRTLAQAQSINITDQTEK